ncbi:hypothetical protein ACEQ8H_003381 [Pleosporales sp. CAS-2024a]
MPPKVVYGKKKNATQTTVSFSKFISPKKGADVAKVDAWQNAVAMLDNTWRQQLEDTAEVKPKEDALEALEKGLKGLKLEHTQTVEAKTRKKGQPRQAVCGPAAVETKENHVPPDTKSVNVAEPQAKSDHDQVKAPQQEVVARLQKPKRRVALESCNTNTRPATTVQVLVPRSNKNKSCPLLDSAGTSPIRKEESRTGRTARATSPRQKQLPTPESTPEPDDIYSAYVSPLLALSYGKRVVPFEQWATELEPHFDVSKIAEASFSEVYRLSVRRVGDAENQESVLKVVALKTPPNAPLPCQLQTRAARDREGLVERERAERKEKDKWKSEVADLLSEVKLLQNLNHIPGFTIFRDLTVLQGRPSPAFSDAWKAWNKSRPRGKKSEFPDPSKKSSYDDAQLWAIVEMQDAGTDCEKIMEQGGLNSIWEVWDVFWGVCLSVAKAEEACKFEHRDLHMGNICVRSSRSGCHVTATRAKDPIRRKFRFTDLDTTVIDYTLSRADIVSSGSNPKVLDVAWLDLNKDPAIFEGDASEEYQYEIYRYMRGVALYKNPLQNKPAEVPLTPRRSSRKNTHIRFDDAQPEPPHQSPRKSTALVPEPVADNIWRQFHPKTNLVWMHFLLHKLLKHVDKAATTPDKLSPKQIMEKVESDEDPAKVKRKAMKLHSVLKRVSELLCPVALGREESLSSVKELVVMALEERWLRVSDVSA